MIGIAPALLAFLPQGLDSQAGAPPAKLTPAHSRATHAQDQLFFGSPGDGSTWVRGVDYKASFTQEGAAFIPWLGSQVETDHPIRFAVASVARGGAPLAFDASAAPARAGSSVLFARGSFVERYDPSPASLEQSFVFESLPGNGDLALSLAVRSDLAGVLTANGLRFAQEIGGADYRRTIAVDAAGRSMELETAPYSGDVEIRVPAAFLESAAFPVTIDPVISTFAIDTTATDDFAPDVAYDASTNTYAVCYEETFSASDHDVYEELLDANGVSIGSGYVDFTTDDWRHPRVANVRTASQYMVAAQVGVPGARHIGTVVIDASTNAMGAQILAAPAFNGIDQENPDIGGDARASGTSHYLVVWEFRDTGTGDRWIVQSLMDTSGLPNGGVSICVECTSGGHDFRPSVSKVSGAAPGTEGLRVVVWEQEFSPSDHDLYGALIYESAKTLGPYPIDTSGYDDRNPCVSSFAYLSSAPANYLVTSERVVGADSDIAGWVMNGSTMVATANLSGAEGPAYFFQDQVGASADSDGRTFAVAYSELYQSSTTDYDVYVAEFDVAGNTIDCIEPHQNLAFTSLPETGAALTAAHHGTALRFLTAWTQESAGNSDIYGGLYRAPKLVAYCYPGLDGVQTCPCSNPPTAGGGCNNSVNTGGAVLAATGNPSLSSDTLSFTQSGERATSLSIVLQGNLDAPVGILWGDGVRCVRGTLKRLYQHNAVAGSVTAPSGSDLDVHTRSAALGDLIGAGEPRFYQVYYRDPNLSFCPGGFNVGNGIKAVWVP